MLSGCGGLDFGIEAAGWYIGVRNDFDIHSCNTLRMNREGDVLCAPIEEVLSEDIRKSVGYGKNAMQGAPYATAWDAIGEIRPEKSEQLALIGKLAKLFPPHPKEKTISGIWKERALSGHENSWDSVVFILTKNRLLY